MCIRDRAGDGRAHRHVWHGQGARPGHRHRRPRLTAFMREEHDVRLSGLTTMRVGGLAQRLVTVDTTDELVDAVRAVDDADEPLLVVGGGSNLVISDEGFAGSVVRIATGGITVESPDPQGVVTIRVAAGEVWDDVVVRLSLIH